MDYTQQQQQPQQQPQTPFQSWHMGAPFTSGAGPGGEVSYANNFLAGQPGIAPHPQSPQDLRLNLSGLSVASPPNTTVSPSVANALSPITPVSPAYHSFAGEPSTTPTAATGKPATTYDDPGHHVHLTPNTHAPSSTSSSALPRKRSFNSPSTPSVVEEESMDLSGTDSSDMNLYCQGGNNSPVDGTNSPIMESDEQASSSSNPQAFNAGKPSIGVNNFVTKLYQMITDPKSSQYISWTELGTSFVVSNVGEFSRTILGSHFKHNNFSSFVRQLNMYGFHKINRTPRAQRTTSDSQTWEFSHHKFLRNRPDLLDEIKRKALEPDPMGLKMRLELPGEVAAQIAALREETAKMYELWKEERRRNEKLVAVVARLWETVSGSIGGLPPFPSDILDLPDQPSIVLPGTSASQRLANTGTTTATATTTTNSSPVSSPTDHVATPFFNHHPHPQLITSHHPHHPHPYALSRQHSFHHLSFSSNNGGGGRSDPPSPSLNHHNEDLFPNPSGGRLKRQRTLEPLVPPPSSPTTTAPTSSATTTPAPPAPTSAPSDKPVKKVSRARSDSAPLGLGYHQHHLQQQSYAWGYPPPPPPQTMFLGGTRGRSGSAISPPPASMTDG